MMPRGKDMAKIGDERHPKPRTDKKVLFLPFDGGAVGGVARVVSDLGHEFQARGWLVRIALPHTHADLARWYRAEGVIAEAHPAVSGISGRRGFHEMRALTRFIQESKSDVVNLHCGGSNIPIKEVVAIRLAGRHRCVVTIHEPEYAGTARRKRWLTRIAGRLVDTIVCGTSAARMSALASGAQASKTVVIPYGVGSPINPPTRAEARARLSLPAEAFVIGSVARLMPYKGIADLITACSRLDDPKRSLQIIIAGTGPERQALENLATSRLSNCVSFLGRVSDPADLYAASDVFVLPSHWEGFGLVYIEAAFHGVPSIGARVGGVPEAIVDGETGLLVPVGDIGALATAIQRLRDDTILRVRLGEAARVRARTEFTSTRMATLYMQVFESLIAPQLSVIGAER